MKTVIVNTKKYVSKERIAKLVEKSDIKNVFDVFKDGIKYYFKHFPTLAKYMSFPVFGQILGLIIIAITTTIFNSILPNLITKYEIFQTPTTIISTAIIVTIPGLAIFLRAFWRYIAAYGTISSMTANMIKSGNIYDISAHNELINRSAGQYILLWLLLSVFGLFAIIPIFWVPALILFVYFVLIFQVFTLDEAHNSNGNAIASFKQSYGMIKGHFFSTLLLLFLVWLVSYVAIPQIFNWCSSKIGLASQIISTLKMDPDFTINVTPHLTAMKAVELVISTIIATIVTMFTLPMRTITWTLWYKKLAPKYNRELKKASKKSKVVKLDQRILDRAMEDYD